MDIKAEIQKGLETYIGQPLTACNLSDIKDNVTNCLQSFFPKVEIAIRVDFNPNDPTKIDILADNPMTQIIFSIIGFTKDKLF